MRLINVISNTVDDGFRLMAFATVLGLGLVACQHVPPQDQVTATTAVATTAVATITTTAKVAVADPAHIHLQMHAQQPGPAPALASASVQQAPVENKAAPVIPAAALPVSSPTPAQVPQAAEKVQSLPAPAKTGAIVKPVAIAKPVAVTAIPTVPKAPAPVAVAEIKPVLAGTVQGSVVILGKNSEKLVPQDVIVSLEPLFAVPANKTPARIHEIDMKGKRYMPGAMAIRSGDKVNFHNRDSIKHNVFSSSGKNTFDLGTYGLNVTQGVSLKHPGIVKVYCNIHAEMATFISINNKGDTYITKADGRFNFSNVPPGEYLLTLWHVRGETRKRFSVAAGKVVQNTITLDTTAFELEPHLNKFGKSYQVNPTLFKDEFY